MLDISKTSHNKRLIWLAIFALSGWFLHLISPILLPFVVGMGVAYLLDPLADKLERRGLSRTIATGLISGGFFIVILMALVALLPLLIEQLTSLLGELPHYITSLRRAAEPHLLNLSDRFQVNNEEALKELSASVGGNLKEIITSVIGGLFYSGVALLNFAALLVITPLVSFYLLRDWDYIMEEMDTLLPRRHAPVIREQLVKIDHTLSAFIRGQINVMLLLAIFYAIGLSLVGLKYSLIIAFIAGILIIIPYVGTLLSGALAVGVAYVQFGATGSMFTVLSIFVVGQMLEGYILTPRLIGKSVGLNPLWIIFGMLAGGSIMGFVGMLIAVPFTAVCGVLIRFAVGEYRKSTMYGDES